MPEHCPLDCSPAKRETWQSLEKCTARQAFLKMLVTEWKGTLSGSGTSQHAIRKACFSKHGEAFKRLSPGQQEQCRKRSITIKRQKIDEFVSQRHLVLAQLELLRQRRREAAASGLVNHMDSCRFDDQDFERFSELWEQFTAQDVSQKLKPPPSRPTPQVESLIQSCVDGVKELPLPEPTWVKGVIDNRDLFVDCFIFNDDESLMPPVVFRIVLAT